jgi:hypothetical protein
MTTMPPEPIMAPARAGSRNRWACPETLRGQAAARRPADLNGLEFFLVGNAAADIEDQLPQGYPHGNLHQAGVGHIPTTEKTAVPGLPAVPMLLNHSAPFSMMGGTVARVLTLLITVGGCPNRPLSTG